jgi:hypothetical protein
MNDETIQFAMNKAVHSDFLIHWTGYDIDRKYDPEWWKRRDSVLNKEIIKPYLERLKYILKYGLWMNRGEDAVEFNSKRIKIPLVARACFTELRLSEVRMHAQKFGRLGIGFKRFFVFNRLGFPMIYFRPEREHWLLPPLLYGRDETEIKEFWACFLKSMDEKRISGQLLEYKQFDEAEWRIIYSKEIEERLRSMKKETICKLFKKPGDISDSEFQDYIKKYDSEKKLEFLIPLEDLKLTTSQWFTMIIYPTLAVKVASEANKEIRSEIERLKPTASVMKLNELISSASYEYYSKPVELDLDSCRNF